MRLARATNPAAAAQHAFRLLSTGRQAWWCADVCHLAYSAVASVAAIAYIATQPRSLLLTRPPADATTPLIMTAASTGQ